jgi:signal transduction histidine kinase
MIKIMRNADSPFLADLLAISLRWLVLFGLALSLGLGGAFQGQPATGPHNLAIIALLVLSALWNGFVSALAIFNRRLPLHRHINVALDVLVAAGLYLNTGGMAGPLPWTPLLPLFSAAVYFNTPGAFLAAGLMALVQSGHAFWAAGRPYPLLAAALITAANLAGALLVSLLSGPLVRRLRATYQGTVQQRKEVERSAQRLERDRMRALFAMIETFSSTLNHQTVLETALETAISALDSRGGSAEEMVGAVLLFGANNRLQVTAARRFHAGDFAVALKGDDGVLQNALRKSEVCLLKHPGGDPELAALATMQAQSIALCLPLVRGSNVFGVMLFGHQDAEFFTADRVETLHMLGNQAVIALQNARLYQDLAREKERIVQTQEEAQKKLARDLHDGPTQSVAAIAMRVSIARRMLERSPGEAAEELIRIEELARRTTQEIRHMLFTLRPLVLESEGLVAALNMMADKIYELYRQMVIIEVEPEVIAQLDATRQTVIFYLAEEAASNARKHAKAAEIRVRLGCVPKIPDVAMLEISDNGVGFDLEAVMNTYERSGSLGMINLRERAEQINGLLKIDSTPGAGTCIRVFIPLTDEAADRLHQRR